MLRPHIFNNNKLSIYLGPFPQFGGSRQHRRNNKTMGISLRSSGNDEGPSRVWMALLEQHSPSSPVFHNLRRFIYAISPTASTTLVKSSSSCCQKHKQGSWFVNKQVLRVKLRIVTNFLYFTFILLSIS